MNQGRIRSLINVFPLVTSTSRHILPRFVRLPYRQTCHHQHPGSPPAQLSNFLRLYHTQLRSSLPGGEGSPYACGNSSQACLASGSPLYPSASLHITESISAASLSLAEMQSLWSLARDSVAAPAVTPGVPHLTLLHSVSSWPPAPKSPLDARWLPGLQPSRMLADWVTKNSRSRKGAPRHNCHPLSCLPGNLPSRRQTWSQAAESRSRGCRVFSLVP